MSNIYNRQLSLLDQAKPVLGKCKKCNKDATLCSPSGTLYCKNCGHCKRKVYRVMKGVVVVLRECNRSVEQFVMHPRLRIYTCSCLLEFDVEMSKREEMKKGKSA